MPNLVLDNFLFLLIIQKFTKELESHCSGVIFLDLLIITKYKIVKNKKNMKFS